MRRKADPEKMNAYAREWKAKRKISHADEQRERRERDRASYASNPEPRKEESRVQRANMTEEQKAADRRRINAANAVNPARQRGYRLKAAYGLSVFSVSRMMRDQDCKCMICSRPFDFSRRHAYAVDHSHKTGRNRGLLCQPCNLGLGALQDNPSVCRLAAEYLEKFGG